MEVEDFAGESAWKADVNAEGPGLFQGAVPTTEGGRGRICLDVAGGVLEIRRVMQ